MIDANGETRLFVEISPDPAFNGGTITGTLKIDRTGQATGTPFEVDAEDANNSLAYGSTGRFVLGMGDETAGVAVLGNTDLRQLYLFVGLDPLYAQNAAGTQAILVRADTFTELSPIIDRLTAPADGDLVAGQCALWFDQTDGAAKLMVKAKSANGTVRTGSLALA